MKRFAVLVVLCLASCAKREEKPEVPPAPAVTPTVAPLEKGPASKFQGMPIKKPLVNHIPGKDEPAAASASAAPSAK